MKCWQDFHLEPFELHSAHSQAGTIPIIFHPLTKLKLYSSLSSNPPNPLISTSSLSHLHHHNPTPIYYNPLPATAILEALGVHSPTSPPRTPTPPKIAANLTPLVFVPIIGPLSSPRESVVLSPVSLAFQVVVLIAPAPTAGSALTLTLVKAAMPSSETKKQQ